MTYLRRLKKVLGLQEPGTSDNLDNNMMDLETYMVESGATDERDYSEIQARMGTERNSKLVHYAMGLVTESGEIMDQLKKVTVYGKQLDVVNLKEELGDVLWYMARMIEELDTSLEEIAYLNNKKLKARYGEKFSKHSALNRNLNKERNILEGRDE